MRSGAIRIFRGMRDIRKKKTGMTSYLFFFCNFGMIKRKALQKSFSTSGIRGVPEV